PFLKSFRLPRPIQRHADERRLLLISRNLIKIFPPRRILWHRPTLFEHDALELFDPQLLHDEFESSLIPILLLPQSSKYPSHGPRHRQQLFFRQEISEQLGLMGHGP